MRHGWIPLLGKPICKVHANSPLLDSNSRPVPQAAGFRKARLGKTNTPMTSRTTTGADKGSMMTAMETH
jgi:hypothetical protein